jgi:membrane-bound ClpP family serine protease
MNLIVLLFLSGILLLAFEVFVPGAVLGILGALGMIGGCVLSFLQFGTAGGFTAVAIMTVSIVLMLWVELFVFPKTTAGRRFFLNAEIRGTSQAMPANAVQLIGKIAEAATPLVPTGYVQIEGRRYEAVSLDGMISKGTLLRVKASDNFTLRVNRLSQNP